MNTLLDDHLLIENLDRPWSQIIPIIGLLVILSKPVALPKSIDHTVMYYLVTSIHFLSLITIILLWM